MHTFTDKSPVLNSGCLQFECRPEQAEFQIVRTDFSVRSGMHEDEEMVLLLLNWPNTYISIWRFPCQLTGHQGHDWWAIDLSDNSWGPAATSCLAWAMKPRCVYMAMADCTPSWFLPRGWNENNNKSLEWATFGFWVRGNSYFFFNNNKELLTIPNDFFLQRNFHYPAWKPVMSVCGSNHHCKASNFLARILVQDKDLPSRFYSGWR